jgi:hypothetical protein
MVRKGKSPFTPDKLDPRLYFAKAKLRAKAKWRFIIFQSKRLAEVMDVVPLLLPIAVVKNCM